VGALRPALPFVVEGVEYQHVPLQRNPLPTTTPNSSKKAVIMSLWTPDGEVPVTRGGADPSARAASPSDSPAGAGAPGVNDEAVRSAAEAMGIDPSTLSPEDRERLVELVAQMAEAQQRLAGAPADDVVANHAMGLYEFAAIKLGSEPPQLADARIAIDALGAVMDAVGGHLGRHTEALTEALDSIRMVWVQINDAMASEPPADS
jgi:hypothetical protein